MKIKNFSYLCNIELIIMMRKRITDLLAMASTLVLIVTGVLLMAGSRSESVSHVHYVGGILFVIIAVGHVAKRWKIFRALF